MAISIMMVFLGMLAGISLLAFINHFFISLRLNWNSLHLRFSAVCLTAMVYTLCTMLEYQTTSIDSYFNLIRVQMFAVSFFMTAAILFTATYTGGRITKPVAAFIGLINLFMIARLFHPTTLTFADPKGMKPYTLPWNETLWLADAGASAWSAAYYVMLLGFLLVVFSLLRSQYRAGKRQESRAMFWAVLILLLSAANDVIVVSFGLQWIYLGDLGYVGLVAVMSARLSSDVARLTETKKKLRGLEVQRQAIFNSMSHFTGLLDSEGRILDANKAALEFVGRPLEELRGLPFRDTPWWRGLPEEQGKLDDAMAQALKGETVRFETRHTNARGERLVIDFSLTPLANEDGAVTHLVPEGRDITEMHAAREEIRKQNAKLELANQEINATNEELQAALGDDIGKITRVALDFAVADKVAAVIIAAAVGEEVPVSEALLRAEAIAHMPLTADPTGVAIRRQHIRRCRLARQILDGAVVAPPQTGGQSRIHVALADPIVNAVLRGNTARQDRGPRR